MLALSREFGQVLLRMIVVATALATTGCIRESLNRPLAVTGRMQSALVLSDGTLAVLPGVTELHDSTPVMDAACKRGVEIDQTRPVGLLRIRHTCGNDPIRYHVARVDLASLAVFFGEADTEKPDYDRRHIANVDQLNKYGLRMSDYFAYQSWLKNPPKREFIDVPIDESIGGTH